MTGVESEGIGVLNTPPDSAQLAEAFEGKESFARTDGKFIPKYRTLEEPKPAIPP